MSPVQDAPVGISPMDQLKADLAKEHVVEWKVGNGQLNKLSATTNFANSQPDGHALRPLTFTEIAGEAIWTKRWAIVKIMGAPTPPDALFSDVSGLSSVEVCGAHTITEPELTTWVLVRKGRVKSLKLSAPAVYLTLVSDAKGTDAEKRTILKLMHSLFLASIYSIRNYTFAVAIDGPHSLSGWGDV